VSGLAVSYSLAIITFLVGAALGVSVARRRIGQHATTAATEPRVAPTGSPVTARAAAPRVVAAAGAIAAQVGTVDDVLVAALDALPSGVVIGDANGSVMFKNAAARAISGVRHVDVLVEEAVESMVGSAVHAEVQQRRFETAGSPSRAFDIRARRLANGRIIATIEDVTEQSRIDTVRTDFVANLSHELKTPIGGIAALADTMIGETDPQVIERLTSRIVDESYRLSRIVDDLLDLSRIEFGGADGWEPVALSDVVSEVVARMQHEAKRTGCAGCAGGRRSNATRLGVGEPRVECRQVQRRRQEGARRSAGHRRTRQRRSR